MIYLLVALLVFVYCASAIAWTAREVSRVRADREARADRAKAQALANLLQRVHQQKRVRLTADDTEFAEREYSRLLRA